MGKQGYGGGKVRERVEIYPLRGERLHWIRKGLNMQIELYHMNDSGKTMKGKYRDNIEMVVVRWRERDMQKCVYMMCLQEGDAKQG